MRKVLLSMMVSLDGQIARQGGDLGWFKTDAGFEAETMTLLRNVEAMIFGRVAYELLAQYWPTAGTTAAVAPGDFTSHEREVEFARLMNTIPKIVVSRRRFEPKWGPATVLGENFADEIRRKKEQPGKDLVVFAGAGVAASFMNLDLVDEFRLMVHPIALGKGTPLWTGLARERPLRLVSSKAFDSGVVLLRYERGKA